MRRRMRRAAAAGRLVISSTTAVLRWPLGAVPRALRALKDLTLLNTLIALLSLVVGVVGLWIAFPPDDEALDREPETDRRGRFNVGVAGFAVAGRQDPALLGTATDLSDEVYRDLLRRLRNDDSLRGKGIEVVAPEKVGPVTGMGPEDRATQAHRVSAQKNLDVIAYGTLDIEKRLFRTEFYLSDLQLVGAEELAGRYEFGVPVPLSDDVTTNVVAFETLRRELVQRSRALLYFVVGLHHHRAGAFDEALSYFERADQVGSWTDRYGRAVLHLSIGNTLGKQGHFRAAARHYRRAHRASGGQYGRALLGLAEIEMRSAGDCTKLRPTRRQKLARALRLFTRVLRSAPEAGVTDLHEKASLGLGRVHLCRSRAGVTKGWATAQRFLASVTREYERSDTLEQQRMYRLAYEAYGNLGLVKLLARTRPTPARLKRAAYFYDRAIALSRGDAAEPERVELFREMRDFVQGRLATCCPHLSPPDVDPVAVKDARPDDVKEQIQFYIGGNGGPDCPGTGTRAAATVVDDSARTGDVVQVCFWIPRSARWLGSGLPVAVRRPDGTIFVEQVEIIPAFPRGSSKALRHATLLWRTIPTDPTGTYVVDARQRGYHVRTTFELRRARRTQVVVTPYEPARAGDEIRLALGGYRPFDLVRLDLYKAAPPEGGESLAHYHSSVLVPIDRHGEGLYAWNVGFSTDPGCYQVVVGNASRSIEEFCIR